MNKIDGHISDEELEDVKKEELKKIIGTFYKIAEEYGVGEVTEGIYIEEIDYAVTKILELEKKEISQLRKWREELNTAGAKICSESDERSYEDSKTINKLRKSNEELKKELEGKKIKIEHLAEDLKQAVETIHEYSGYPKQGD